MSKVTPEDDGTPIGGVTANGCKVVNAEKKGITWYVTVDYGGVKKTQTSPQRLKAEQLACDEAKGE